MENENRKPDLRHSRFHSIDRIQRLRSPSRSCRVMNERIFIVGFNLPGIARQSRSVDAERNRKRRPDMRETSRKQDERFLRNSRRTQRNSAHDHSLETRRMRKHILGYYECAEAVAVDENRKSGMPRLYLLEIRHHVAAVLRPCIDVSARSF